LPATGTGGSFTFTPDDNGTYVVTLSAKDDDGMEGTKSATIDVTNALPTATITGVYSPTAPVVTTQEPVEFQGRFSDAGTADTHTVTWTFGDGSSSTQPFTTPSGSEEFEAYHSYAAPGTYQVGLTVLDDDGGSGSASYTLIVQTPAQAIDAIAGYIQSHAGLSTGEKNSLLAKLRAASNAADRGSFGAACNQLDAFLNEVDAMTKAGRLSSSDQTILTGATRATQRSLGCFGPLFAFLGGF
jgi:PKD repeat protein